MWLHPPFFSIVEPHSGHSLVFADIQFAVSESSSHFFNHFLTREHGVGWCSLSVHPKQKLCEQAHWTEGTIWFKSRFLIPHSTAYSQLGAGHHFKFSLSST